MELAVHLYALGPRARHVYNRLRERILGGELPTGVMLPAQRELAAGYGVSPMTARLAVAALEEEGLVVRKPRRGTFVAAPAPRHRSGLPLETSQPNTEAALREAQEHYRTLLDGAPIGISLADLDGNLIVVNAAYQKIVGYTEDELRSMRFTDLTHPDDIAPDLALFEQALAGTIPGYELEKRYIRKDGTVVWTRVRILVARDADGKPTYDIAMVEDISDRKALEERLRHHTLHDDVTNLPNRILLSDRAGEAICRARRDGAPLAVLLLDLVGFRLINDTFGHAYGDRALEEVGRRLRRLTRRTDMVARITGDQFAILLEGADGPDARCVADLLCRGLEEPYRLEEQSLYLAARIGIAVYPEHGTDIRALLRGAAAATHVAKERGETAVLYDPTHDQNTSEVLTLIADLRRALNSDEITLHFQPKLDLRTGRVCGVEALARWHHPTRGLVPPDEFIPLAEGSGLIEPLTRHVLDAALSQCAAWRQAGTPLNVAINVSADSLHTSTLVDTILEALERWSVPPSLLTLEVTETAFMRNPATASEVVRRLHGMGIRIAIDDFGTGYSSLAYLSRLPVDEIKIDRAFVAGMRDSTGDGTIVRAVVRLGHEMGIDVVAEGVETAQMLHDLRQIECDIAQGYLLTRPLPAPAFAVWMEAWEAGQEGATPAA